MEISNKTVNDALVVNIKGRIDTNYSSQFETEVQDLIKNSNKHLLFNFSEVDYISSSGLRAVLMFAKLQKNSNKKLVLFSLNDNIKEILNISGFSSIIPMAKDETEAIGSL